MTQPIDTELGLMQAMADAEREAKRVLAEFTRNFKGRLAPDYVAQNQAMNAMVDMPAPPPAPTEPPPPLPPVLNG